MTPDERNMLQQFFGDLSQTRGTAKDPEADAMIHQALQANPDAAYLLVQHAILADQALHAAQAQIAQLESEVGAPAPSGSFLSAAQGSAPQYTPAAYQPADYAQPPYQDARPAPSGPFSANSGLGGFLRTAGTMAAGVAGGEFLAQGLSNLFSPRDW
jgi:hypothetical protein